MRYIGYCRHSTDKQNPKSVDDQLFEIRTYGDARDWTFVKSYKDAAVSGSSIFGRDAYQEMLQDAREGRFDCIIAEDLDRLSRNPGDLAKLRELMEFLEIEIVSLSKGEPVNELDIGFKGLMSSQFLRDAAQKTKRGLAANIRNGKSAGGLSYGYRVTIEPGVIAIDEEQAEIVRRIFGLYAVGYTPRQIAGILNAEGIPGPRGAVWNASAINGHRARGTGILRNELYIGVRVWNRTATVRNPETGRRITKVKPKHEHLRVEVPDLRILDQDRWNAVQARLPNRKNKRYRKRQKYLLSGKMKCGECGRNFIALGSQHEVKFGCGARRERTNCSNRRIISRAIIDNCVLVALLQRLLKETCTEPAVEALIKEYSRLSAHLDSQRPKLKRRLSEITKGRIGLLKLLEKGIQPEALVDRLRSLEEEERLKKRKLSCLPTVDALDVKEALKEYQIAVKGMLQSSLSDNYAYKQEVRDKIRSLIDKVIIYPKDDPSGRDIELVGDVEYLFLPNVIGMKTLVAGAGFEPATFRL